MLLIHAHRLTPVRALLLSWTVWLICYVLLPVEPAYITDQSGLAILLGANLAFILGASTYEARRAPAAVEADLLRHSLKVWTLIGAAGVGARVVDYFVFRGVSVSDDSAEVRQLLETGPNAFSVVYALFAPISMAAMLVSVLLLLNGRGKKRLPLLTLAVAAVIPALGSLQGSRSLLLVFVAPALIAAVLSVRRITIGGMLASLAVVVVMCGIMIVTQAARFASEGRDILEVIRVSGYTESLPVTHEALELLGHSSPFVARILFFLISAGQYYTHGVFEFFEVVAQKQWYAIPDPLLWGRYQFFIVDQVLKLFTPVQELLDLETYNPRSGLFATFWAPAYFDFGGVGAVIYTFFLGLGARFVFRRVAAGDVYAFPLYCLVALQVFLMPVANSITGAGALFYDLSLLGLWAFYRWKLRRGRQAAIVATLPAAAH